MDIRVAIVGPTGYTGLWLIDWLLRHPRAKLTYLAARRDPPVDMTLEYPQLLGRLPAEVAQTRPIDPEAIARAADVALLALPHKAAMHHAGPLLDAGVRVIDLSADYRLADRAVYESVYQESHEDPDNLAEAVYGLPELFRKDLPGAMLVANPGCYPTTAVLGLAPLLERSLVRAEGAIINAASGVTGAGRNPAPHLHFPEQNESFMAYATIGGHRHQVEIEQALAVVAGRPAPVLFVPHLLPVDQGILATMYLDPADPEVTEAELFEAFAEAYADEPFVRVVRRLPNVKHVRNTNFCDVTVRLTPPDAPGFADDDRPPKVVVFSALDNMVKGAAGQAIQNMNAVFELPETTGLL
jgi:N-acetyl-gamma-glutamyl-phosphate reductase